MATSGTTTFNLSIDDLVEEAFERCGMRPTSGYQLASARRSLNLLFLDWANRGLNLWTIEQANNLQVQCRSFCDSGRVEFHGGNTCGGAAASAHDVSVKANLGLGHGLINLDQEQLSWVVDHVGNDLASGDVDRTRVVVLPGGLACGGVDVLATVEHADSCGVRSGCELDQVAIINGDEVALENCSGLVISNFVAVLSLCTSGREIAERTQTKGFVDVSHLSFLKKVGSVSPC